jgi:16S rRNA (guanine527-N7)-methyltransferase
LTARQPALEPAARRSLERVLELLAADPRSLTSVRDPAEARNVHVADSLAGLEVPELAGASAIADVGAGAGFPGLALAAALPGARVDLIESVGRKAAFIEEAALSSGLSNARAVPVRSEEWALSEPPDGGWQAYDAVTARAVGRLAVVAELASPLLREGGVLVAWKGARNRGEESELEAAAPGLAMRPDRVLAVTPYPASRNRHLHVVRKVGATPSGLPRRPGRAGKRRMADRVQPS